MLAALSSRTSCFSRSSVGLPSPRVPFDRAPDAVVDLDAERGEQRLEAGHGLAREILVADERPVRVAIPEGADGVVDQPPEQDRLVDLVPLVLGEVADLVLERRQVVAEEQRLVEEEREVVRPAEPLDAAHERRGMADQHDHLRVEARGEPLAREDGDRILQQRSRPAPPAGGEARRSPCAVRPTSRGVRIVAQLPPEAVAEARAGARTAPRTAPRSRR